jgi:hypothetical protein
LQRLVRIRLTAPMQVLICLAAAVKPQQVRRSV